MRRLLAEWLRSADFVVLESAWVSHLELDVVDVGDIMMSRGIVKKADVEFVYAFDIRVVNSKKLLKAVVEQAITRLFIADYTYIAVPKKAVIQISDGRQNLWCYQIL